jgi:hypothetical protein
MTRILCVAWVAICLALTASCTTPYTLYRQDIFAGKQALRQGEFGEARSYFLKAATEQKRATAFAYAATASYKLGDLASAEGYISEAERAEGGTYSYIRIAGYKALILLKEGKKEEGLAALKTYIDDYRLVYPLMTIDNVENMWKKGKIDQALLEKLLDEQITNFENEIEQAATTGTGYYSTRPPVGGLIPFLMPD